MEGSLLFLMNILTVGAIYAVLCLALNFSAGIDGLWDLGLVSFFGIGAYTYVLLTAPAAASYQDYILGLGLPIWSGVIVAGLIAWVLAVLVGLPALRLKREYFLITTLALSEVLRQIYSNELWLTNGVAGIYNISPPFRGGTISASTASFFLFLLLIIVSLVTLWFVRQLTTSSFGRSLKALRDNEDLAKTAGINPFTSHITSYSFAAFFCGLSGAFYTWYTTIIVPSMFTPDVTFFVWTALIIGGLGNTWGAYLGGFIFILIQEGLRFLPVYGEAATTFTSLRVALIGLILIVILRVRPEGLIGERPLKTTSLTN